MGYMAYDIIIACQMLLEYPKFEKICHLVRSMWNPQFLWAKHFLKRTNTWFEDTPKPPRYSGSWWKVFGLRIGYNGGKDISKHVSTSK